MSMIGKYSSTGETAIAIALKPHYGSPPVEYVELNVQLYFTHTHFWGAVGCE